MLGKANGDARLGVLGRLRRTRVSWRKKKPPCADQQRRQHRSWRPAYKFATWREGDKAEARVAAPSSTILGGRAAVIGIAPPAGCDRQQQRPAPRIVCDLAVHAASW